MKHERAIKPEPKPNWRLKKTLARRIEIRAFDEPDMKYLWAAYKKLALAGMGAHFADGSMDAAGFRAAFDEIADRYGEAWTIHCETPRGFSPAGIVFSAFAPALPYRVVGGIAWFPWASRRNIVEGTVAFFNLIRKQAPMMGYATDQHKRLYEIVCMHGIMRRVGTSQVVIPGHSAAVFETRA